MESRWPNPNPLHSTSDLLFVFDVSDEGRFLLTGISLSAEKLNDLFKSELNGKYLDEIVPPEILEHTLRYFQNCVETREVVSYEDVPLASAIGRGPRITLFPVSDGAGSIVRIVEIIGDVSGPRRSEVHPEFMNLALDKVLQAIFLTDEHARFHYVNEEACRSLGYSREELLNMGIADIDPEFPINRWPEYWRQRCSDRSITVETKHKTKDGRVFPVEINACFVEQDGLNYSLSFARDISERKEFESELITYQERLRNLHMNLQKMRESERANIAREIHDELGQVMAVIKMDLAWLQRKYASNEGILKKTTEAIELVDSTIRSIKKICTELRPGILDHLGIIAAIQWQAEEFQTRTGIICDVEAEGDIHLDSDRSTALFRIFQEALTNVMRHSGATKIVAKIYSRDNNVVLEIADNGRGIADEEISRHASFGILGMHERVYPWKGTVNISGRPNEGTRIIVTLPCA